MAINWKKIKRLLPSPRRFALDRIPTMEELYKIIEHSDVRGKALTLVFCSSGIREGAIEALVVRNLKAITGDMKDGAGLKEDVRVLGKLTVYEGDVRDDSSIYQTE